MAESQNIEWKQSWHDDYLKWISGFANANGGRIYIGKDDSGKVTHLTDFQRLMEDIPNKIRNAMGIICDVNLMEEDGQKFIEIVVQPYSVPVSIRGRYYYRSGSTKVELTGNTLNDFLLKKAGKTWDDVVEENAQLADLDEASFQAYLKDALKSDRLPDVEGLSFEETLEKLRLLENGKPKRAALVLFGKSPQNRYPNLQVKIGRFGADDADLKFQEVEEGNLVYLLKEIPTQLNRKFFTRAIDFEGLLRIEKGAYPVAAIREMLLNALVHRNYAGSMTQIRVYDTKLTIWNEGLLPEGMSLESLKRQHPSRPRNPILADICFKAGYIDSWGRGTLKIMNSCKAAELPEPEIIEQDGGILVTIYLDRFTRDELLSLGVNERQIKAVEYVKEFGKIASKDYQELNRCSRNTASNDLKNMVERRIFKFSKAKGAGVFYELI